MLSRGHSSRAAAEREVMGVADDNEPRTTAPKARSSRRSAHDARQHLQLVHRGFRHGRLEGRKGDTRPTGYVIEERGSMRCPKCGVENPDAKRFCGDCGAALSTAPAPPNELPPLAAAQSAPAAQ